MNAQPPAQVSSAPAANSLASWRLPARPLRGGQLCLLCSCAIGRQYSRARSPERPGAKSNQPQTNSIAPSLNRNSPHWPSGDALVPSPTRSPARPPTPSACGSRERGVSFVSLDLAKCAPLINQCATSGASSLLAQTSECSARLASSQVSSRWSPTGRRQVGQCGQVYWQNVVVPPPPAAAFPSWRQLRCLCVASSCARYLLAHPIVSSQPSKAWPQASASVCLDSRPMRQARARH